MALIKTNNNEELNNSNQSSSKNVKEASTSLLKKKKKKMKRGPYKKRPKPELPLPVPKKDKTIELLPDKILGASHISGQIMFLMKWTGTDEADLISANQANVMFPQHVIEFYEKHLHWDSDIKS